MDLEERGGHVLLGSGVVCLIFGMVMYAIDADLTDAGFSALGGVLVFSGAAIGRIDHWKLSRAGAEVKLHPPRKQSVEIALANAAENEPPQEIPGELPWYVDAARNALAGFAMGHLLTPTNDDDLSGAELTLFLYDADVDRLRPVSFTEQEDSAATGSRSEWEIGKGATGRAYETGGFVLVTGPEVWDTTYGLTDEQADRYRALTAVASMPVLNAADDVIGVVTATTKLEGGGPLVTPAAYDDLTARTLAISRALVDLLKWFPDQYGEGDGETHGD
ncbi:hypothetical protein [Actinospongicola halichondriae]|uniref:hypothetical protein n=1 Tax=Actinospongicola halichondriae TaxID=3236844 RepID=UPI003D3C3470